MVWIGYPTSRSKTTIHVSTITYTFPRAGVYAVQSLNPFTLSLSYSCTLRAAVVFSCRRFGVTVTTTGSTGEFECEFEFGLESVNTTGTFTSVYGVMCGVRFVPRRSELPRCESKSRTLCCGCGVWCRVWCMGRAARTTSSQNVAAA